MPLLPSRQLRKLLLRNPLPKPLQPRKHLPHIRPIHKISIRSSNQILNHQHTILIQLPPQPIINLSENLRQKPITIILPPTRSLKHPIHKSRLHKFLTTDFFTHNQRLICLRWT